MELRGHLDAQTSVLGCLMLAGDELAGEIFQRVSAEDFSSAEHRRLFESARDAFLANEPVDPVTMVARAGAAYEPMARSILELTPTAAHWAAYCEQLHEASRLRRLQDAAAEVSMAETAEQAAEILLRAQSDLTDKPGSGIVTFAEGYRNFLLQLDPKNRPVYEDWGIPELNERVRVRPGSYIVIGAGTSVGKSALAAQFAVAAARKKKVGFFSFEMSDRELMERIGAHLARIDFSRVQGRGTLTDIQMAARAAEGLGDIQLEIINAGGFSSAQIRAVTLARKFNLIVVDYIQLVAESGSGRTEAVTKATMGLQRIAKTLGVTVLALSQFSRQDKAQRGQPPTLADLRESGQIEQDADVIMMLYRLNEEDRNGPRWLSVAKNRGGPCGKICLSFDPRFMEFAPCNPAHYIAVEQPSRKSGLCRPATPSKKPTQVQLSDFRELDDREEVPF